MELIDLNATARDKSGKGACRQLRRDNKIPAVVYGAKIEPAMLSLDTSSFDKIIREHGSTGLFFNLNVDGQEKVVMLKDLQMDTFGLNYVHIDFHEIDMNKPVNVVIPVEAVGESAGVKAGGLLQVIRRELEVLCKPKDTPEKVEVDITALEIGDSVHVEDIDLGDAVEIPHEVNFTIVTIVPPTVDEVEEDDEEEFDEAEAAAPAEEPEAAE